MLEMQSPQRLLLIDNIASLIATFKRYALVHLILIANLQVLSIELSPAFYIAAQTQRVLHYQNFVVIQCLKPKDLRPKSNRSKVLFAITLTN